MRRWVQEDHLYNCVTMLERVRAQGYTGGISQLKAFVHPLRPPKGGRRPVRRYETKPGEQMQFDWGEFCYEADGVAHKVYGFTAILGYSRMRFVTFVKRADSPTLIRCLMEAFEYVGGVPQAVLTDRMKSVLLAMEDGQPHWHPVKSRLCRQSGRRAAGLQGIYATDKRFDGILHSFRMISVFLDTCEHASAARAHRAAGR